MSKIGNFVKVYDPANPTDWYEVVDQYAREQLILKTEKKYVNALPALPTSKADWDEKKKSLYYYGPLTDQGSTESHYEVWSIFFKLDEQTASAADFTNQANYEWVQLGSTSAELENFSTKGHTHEVVPETSVEDHEYTPQGTVTSTFTGGEATTSTNAHSHTLIPEGSVSSSFSGTPSTTESDTHSHTITPSGTVTSTFSGTQGTTSENTHNHTFTPSGDVSGTFSGEQGTTGNSTTGATITQTKKKLSTKKMSVAPSTSVDFTNSTIAQRATGALEDLSTYDASKAVFNGITVDQDGGLSFVVKKMTTDDAVSALQASIDASKVTYDNSGTASNVDVATGALETDAQAANQVLTNAEISDSGHTHTFTPSGAISASFSGTQGTTSDHKHTHTITPEGSVSSSFSGNSGTTSEDTHNHSYKPAGTVTSNFTGSAGTTSEVEHSHTVTPSGEVVSGFRGVRANLKHKVDNKKVRTSPDTEDEGSHAFDWYGIEFDEDLEDPVKTRIGNRDMHRMLPIQTKMRRCLLKDDGTVYNYLDADNSIYYAQGSLDIAGNDIGGQRAELNGSARNVYGDNTSDAFNVQVMVEYPEHWRKVYTYLNGSTSMVRAMISPYPQDTTGWIHIKKGYVSAYEASIVNSKLCSISDVKNLELSVVDGKVNATCDVSTATGQSDITSQLPTTNQTMDAFRTAARLRETIEGDARWNQLVYEQYLTICWLYYIEYANLNSQEQFTTALDMNGYHQGGLGNGVTTVDGSIWNTFNGYRPFVPCGITNCLGNQSGEVLLALPSTFGTNVNVAVPSYRGIENIFGHIWEFADGIKYLGDGSKQSVLRCNNPADYSSASSSTGYTSIGDNYGANGWKTKIMIGDDGDINCKAVGGSSNLAYCVYNHQEHTNNIYYCCRLGGCAGDGARAGLACVHSSSGVSISRTSFGSRLCFYNV